MSVLPVWFADLLLDAAIATAMATALGVMAAILVARDQPWAEARTPLVRDRVRNRLKPLSARLGEEEWLDGAFSAGDLMMVSVLLRLRASGLLNEYDNLAAYGARGAARPAYQRAFADQLAVNTAPPPPG